MKKLILLFIACCVSSVSGQAALGMSSANYVNDPDVISSGGGGMSSANYTNASTLGQSGAIGQLSSMSYALDAGYWATGAAIQRRLSVSIAGTGTGSITTDVGAILWSGSTGTAYYNNGQVVTLTAAPEIGSTFTGWSGGGCSGTGPCIVTMDADKDTVANIAINTFAISATVSAGSGTIVCSPNPVNYNGPSLCTITPSGGYGTIGVIVDGAAVGSPPTYQFTNVTANHTISASFGLNYHRLTVAKTGTGAGTVTSNPAGINCGSACSGGFAQSPPISLFHAAEAGSTFVGWSGACTGIMGCVVSVLTDTAVTAQFDDTAGPILVISALPDGSSTNQATFSINGTVTDNIGVQSLVISGQTVTVKQDHTFSHALLLSSGTNTITTTAMDPAGNRTADMRVITLDQTAPGLTISSPADNSSTNQGTIAVSGTVEADTSLFLSLNSGASTTVSFTGTAYSTSVILIPGANTIDVTARDAAGNTNTLHRTVTYDGAAPSLAITQPVHDTVTSASTVVISGAVSDNIGPVTVLITTGAASYSPQVTGGTFSQTITFATEGAYAVTVSARDEAGNTATVIRNIIYSTAIGDVDGSGSLDITDALAAFRAYLGFTTLTAEQNQRCDVAPLGRDGRPDPNGVVDVADIILLLRKAVGLVSW